VKVDELLQRVGEHLTVGRSFGPSYEHGDTLVIPVALVAGGGGGGGGSREGGDGKPEEGEGGGFGGLVYPIGAYVVSEGRVRFVPTFDATRLIAGVLLLLRLLVKRPRRAHTK
jgi:uncharacterized spore protein YtfJ